MLPSFVQNILMNSMLGVGNQYIPPVSNLMRGNFNPPVQEFIPVIPQTGRTLETPATPNIGTTYETPMAKPQLKITDEGVLEILQKFAKERRLQGTPVREKKSSDYVSLSQTDIPKYIFKDDTQGHKGYITHGGDGDIVINSKYKNEPDKIKIILEHELVHRETAKKINNYRLDSMGIGEHNLSTEEFKLIRDIDNDYSYIKDKLKQLPDTKINLRLKHASRSLQEFIAYLSNNKFIEKFNEINQPVIKSIQEKVKILRNNYETKDSIKDSKK